MFVYSFLHDLKFSVFCFFFLYFILTSLLVLQKQKFRTFLKLVLILQEWEYKTLKENIKIRTRIKKPKKKTTNRRINFKNN